MKQLLLILSLTLGLTTTAFALGAGEDHPDPFKVLTDGEVITEATYGHDGSIRTMVIVEYDDEIYNCRFWADYYRCWLLQPSPQ